MVANIALIHSTWVDKMRFTFTIITSTLNCAAALERTALSIRQQTCKSVQWIVVDGSSTDETLAIVEQNSEIIDHWISEPDSGIYDAWNKACKFISGEWVIFLGAGDIFCNSETLLLLEKKLQNVGHDIAICYGNVIQMIGDRVSYRYGRVDLTEWEVFRPKIPAHQGVFQRSRLFDCMVFDTSYKIAADTKFMLSVLPGCGIFYFDVDICYMEPGGVSANPKYSLVAMRELFRIESELGYKIPFVLRWRFMFLSYVKYIVYMFCGGACVAKLSSLKWLIKRGLNI